jgi:hypothetical protein
MTAMTALCRALALAVAVAASACSTPLQPREAGVIREGDIVSGTGTVRFFAFEGGFYAIRGDDDETYDPINLPDEFREDGMRVRFRARLLLDIASIHQAGPVVEVIDIRRE